MKSYQKVSLPKGKLFFSYSAHQNTIHRKWNILLIIRV